MGSIGDWILVTGYIELCHHVSHSQRMVGCRSLPLHITREDAKHHLAFARKFLLATATAVGEVCWPHYCIAPALTYK